MPAKIVLPPFLFAAWRQFAQLKQLESSASTELLNVLAAFTSSDSFGWSPNGFEQFSESQINNPGLNATQKHTLHQFFTQYHNLQAAVALEKFLLALKDNNCSPSTIKNYRSDIAQFLEFTQPNSISETLTKPKIDDFVRYQREKGLQVSSIRRKLSSLAQFGGWLQKQTWFTQVSANTAKPSENENKVSPEKNEGTKPVTHANTSDSKTPDLQAQIEELSEKLERRTRSFLLPWVSLLMLLLFFGGLAVFGYRQLISRVIQPLAYPSSPTRPNRVLSFQGRLTDTAQNPIVTATNMRFRLYDSGPSTSGGNLLWDSGTCSVDPDQDGIFSSGLGDDCGSEIDPNVFSENANVWLQVDVGAETLSPRQPIRTVAYALNSETLQGYPISATGAATANTVLVMDSAGDIVLGEVSPEIRSGAGTFTISGQTLLLQTNSGSNGNIILDADGTGGVQIRDYLSAPGATLSATYAGGVPLTIAGGPSGTANLTTWTNNAGSTLAYIDSSGNAVINQTLGIVADTDLLNLASNLLTVNGALTATSTINSSGGSIQTNGTHRISNGGNLLNIGSTQFNSVTYNWPGADGSSGHVLTTNGSGTLSWAAAAGLGTNYWRLSNGSFSPVNDTADLLIGGISTASAKFAFINNNTGTPTATIAGNLSLQVPTSSAPSTNLNILNGGTLSIRTATSGQGDAGLGTVALFGNRNVTLYGNRTGSNGLARALTTHTGTGNALVHINPDNIGTADTFGIFQVDGGALDSLFNVYGNGRDKVVIGGSDSTASIRTHILTAANNYVGLAIEANSAQTANLQEWQNSSGVAQSWIDESGNLRIGSAAPDTGKFNITGAFTGKALAIFNETGDQDIFTASASGTTRFVIQNDGDVGIGTGAPTSRLTVTNNGAGDGILVNGTGYNRVQIDRDSTNRYAANIYSTGGTSQWNLGLHDDGTNNFHLWDVSGNKFFTAIDNGTTGLIGINNIAPTAALDITGSASLSGTLSFRGTTDPKINILNAENFDIRTSPGGDAGLTERFTVLSSGRVGVGTTTPIAKLHIVANAGTDFNQASGAALLSGADYTVSGVAGHRGIFPLDTSQRAGIVGLGSQNNTLDILPISNYGSVGVVGSSGFSSGGRVNVGVFGQAYFNQTFGGNSNNSGRAGQFLARLTNTVTDFNGTLYGSHNTADSRGGTSTGGSVYGSYNEGVGETNNTVYGGYFTASGGSTNYSLYTNQGEASFGENLNLRAQADLRLADSDSTNYVALQSPAVVGSDITYTLPGTITNGYVLQTDGSGVMTWADPTTLAGAATYWNQADGALFAKNSTVDLLVGGQSTASAKFAVLNVNTGTPVASVSANSGNIATYLTGDGTLATTNRNALTIGNSSTYNTTGNVLINPNGTGYVGIGTTTPQARLDISGSPRWDDSTSDPTFTIRSSQVGETSKLLRMGFDSTSTNDFAFIQAAETGVSTKNLILQGQGGSVGIGVTNPSYPLSVYGTSAGSQAEFRNNSGNVSYISITDNSTGQGQANGLTLGYNNGAVISNREATSMSFATSDTTRMTITSSGNVGINTAVPGAKLAIDGDLFAPIATFSANYAAGVPLTVKAGPSATGNITEWQNHSGTVLSVIDEVGRLGIGTSGPTADIDIARSPGTGPRIVFRETSGGTNWQIGANIITGSGDEFAFYDVSNTATRLLIDSSGNVGINDTTPDAKFNILATTEQLRLDYDDSNYTSFFTQADGELQLTTTGTDPDITLNPGTSGSLIFADLNCSGNANGGVLTADASGVISCTDDDSGGAGGSSNWRISSGAISPINDTLDVLFGASATSSAKFGFLNVNTGTPVASISANSGNIATYITGDGTLATTNRQTLTIGNSSTYNTTGDVLINPNGTGNVGIGTATPAEKLTIAGNIAPTVANSYSLGNATTDWSNVYSSRFTFSSDIDTYLTRPSSNRIDVITGGSTRVTFSSAGNVGIGTTVPGAKLDVVGDLFAPIATFSANYAGGTALTAKGGPSGTANIFNIQDNSSNNLAFFNSAGDLTLNAQNDLRLADSDSSNYIALQAPSVVGSNLTYTLPGTVTNGYIMQTDGSGNLSWVSPESATGYWRLANGALSPTNDTLDLLVGSNATTSAKFAVLNVNTGTPVASISANSGNIATYITGDGTFATTNRQALTIGNSSTYDTTGDVLINPNGTGRVGIGTNAPEGKLHLYSGSAGSVAPSANGDEFVIEGSGVTGMSILNPDDQVGTIYFGTPTDNIGAAFQFYGPSAGAAQNLITLGTSTSNGEVEFRYGNGTSGIRLNSSGNVGIGTTAPGAKLDVIGNIFAPTATFSANYAGGVALTAKGGPSGTANIFNVQNNSGSTLAFFDSAGNLTLNTQNDLRLADSDSSNYLAFQAPATVGSNITYTFPGTVTNGYILQTDGSGTLTWADPATLGTNYWRLVNGALSPLSDTTDLLIGGVSTASAKFAFINVNSGTPTASISGNLAISSPTGADPANTFDILNGGSLNFRTSPGGNAGLLSRFFIGNNGNVGIGTDTPTSKLQIAGATSTISNSSGDITIDAASNTISLSGDSLANLLNVDASGQIKPGSFVVNPTALGSGSIIYRSDNGYLHYYNGAEWLAIYPGLWQVNLNAFSPVGAYGSVADLLIGGTSTASAKIAMDATTGYLYAQRFVDKANTQYFLDPAATGHSLSVVGKSGFGTANPEHQIHVNATVTGKALAVFNETGNNSILVASSAGTRVFEIQNEGNIIAGNPTKQDINVTVYGDLFSADDTNLETTATGIVASYLYDTATDRDSGYWRKSAVSKTLSWYTEIRDDALGTPCNLSSDDRCGTEYFPAKANLVLSGSNLYIFDALTNNLWMRFNFGSGNAIGAASADHSPSSVTAIDGRIFVGMRGASGGMYELNFKTDTMSFYTTTDRSESAQLISGRNGGSNTYASNSMTAFALTNRSVNDMDVTYGNGKAQLAAATNAGINLIDLDYKLGYVYNEEGSNSNAGDTISDDGNTANPATNAFDGIESTIVRSDAADSALTVTYQFASSKVIKRYGIMADDADLTEAPSVWTFEGSADGSTWVTLDSRSGYDWFDLGTNGNTQYWDISNTTSYPYYRLVVTDAFNAVADNVRIAEIYLQTEAQKPAVRLYGEDMAKNYTPNVSTAANTTTLNKRRVTDWRRVTTNGDYRTATNDTLPYISVSLRRATAITQYTVSASSTDTREPTAWRMQGSNDGVTWATLDTQTSQTFAAAYVSKSYTFSNTTAYKHYRLDITANNAATITEIGDFQVGTPVITASSSSNDTTADETNLLFQDNSAAAYHWLANAGANEWVQYDYGAANPKVITSYALRGYQAAQPTRAITGWSIQGSDNCSSWTTLDTQTGQSFATDYTLNDYSFSNTTAYRCYRLLVNTLNGGTLASLKGLYFFGAEDRLIASSDESDAADNVSRLSDEGDFGRWTSLANDDTGWIEKHFAPNQEATVSGVVLSGAAAVTESIKDFTVYGSNDRVTWTSLLTKKRSSIINISDSRDFKFSNNTAYKFIQLKVDATNNSTSTSLDELKLLGGYYNKVTFSDNAIVGTNANTGQVDIYNTVFSDSTNQALNFTGTLTTDTDAALSSIPSIHSSVAPQLLFPALSGSISSTPYTLEADGGSIYVGNANGVDVIKNNPHSDPDGNFAPAQIGGRINTIRNVNNPFNFDHYWPMDEASSAAQLNNLGTSGWNTAGLEINGTAAAPVSTEAGKINRAYSFSNAQYIEAIRDASATELDSNGEFTIGGWVYQDAAGLTGDQYIMGDFINNATTMNGFGLGMRDGALYMVAGNNGAAVSLSYESAASVPTEEWTHVVVKLESSTLKFYVNGELRDSAATAAFTDGGIFYIGWIDNNGATNNRWQGRLDELFVKHSLLSDEEIKRLYERGLKNGQDHRAQIMSPDTITANDASVVSTTTIGSSTLNLAINSLAGKVVEITGGTGAGQTRLITKNSATTLTVSPAWSTTPDSTSDFEVTPYALPGSVNTAKALRADGQNVFVGLNDGANGGGVVRLGQKSLAVSDYYHGNAGKTDSTGSSWGTTSDYDDIVGVESTTDNLFIVSEATIWREKLGESLLEAITRLQQAFSAATLDTHTQDMHGSNVRNATTQVIRKGWGFLDNGDTSRNVYYGITYDDVPVVIGSLAGIVASPAQTSPSSLEQCTLGTQSVDALGVSAIRKDRFSVAEVVTNNACFTWMSIGSYSGSTPEGSFGGNYTGGADLAEWYGTDDTTLEAAEVVSVDPSGEIKVMRSGKPQDSTAIGIIATQPSITLGDKTGLTPGYNTDPQLAKGAKTAVQVALAGRVPVKVSLENGPIKAGDYLTTGTTPGTAAKAIKAGPTIGKALENFDGKSTVVGIVDSQVALSADLTTKLASNSAAIATDSAKVDGTVQITDADQKLLSSGQGVIMAFVNTSYYDPSYNNPVTADSTTNGSYAIDSAGNVVGLGAYSFDLVDNAKYLSELLADAEAIANQTASGSSSASGSATLSSQRESVLQAALARLKALGTLSLKELNTAQLRVLGSLFSRQVETDQLKTDLVSPLTQADLNFKFGTASESGSLNIRNNENEVVTSIDGNGNVTALGSLNAPTASISGELTAGNITAESSRLDYLEGKVAELAHVRAQTAEIVNATISGTLFADDIYEFDAKVAAALEQPTLLSKLMPTQPATPSASLSSILAEISKPTFDTASISGSLQRNLADLSIGENDLILSAEAAYINQYFQVNGNAFFGQSLEVANTAIIGTDLRVASSLLITGNSITADITKLPDQTLYFQPSGQGKLNFLAGVLTINDQGEVTITGNLDITGKLSVKDSLLTNLLQPNDFNQAVQLKLATQSGTVAGASTDTTRSRFEIVDELGTPVATISSQGTASFAGGLELNSEDLTASGSGTITTTQTSGKAQLAAGSTELTIVSSAIKADSLIYITPTSSTGNQVLYVKSQAADDSATPELESKFVVGLDNALLENVQFNWWIIN